MTGQFCCPQGYPRSLLLLHVKDHVNLKLFFLQIAPFFTTQHVFSFQNVAYHYSHIHSVIVAPKPYVVNTRHVLDVVNVICDIKIKLARYQYRIESSAPRKRFAVTIAHRNTWLKHLVNYLGHPNKLFRFPSPDRPTFFQSTI